MGGGTRNDEGAFTEPLRPCFRTPIPEIGIAAKYLDDAVTAHLAGDRELAADLILRADMPAIREYSYPIMANKAPYVLVRKHVAKPPLIPKLSRDHRHPGQALKRELLLRDGYHCRYCAMPLIRSEVRKKMHKLYPASLRWERNDDHQHAAFQAMAVNYDHMLAHCWGGQTDLDNIVISCSPCNYGRMEQTFERVGLSDPRTRDTIRSSWDGLERLLTSKSTPQRSIAA